ncbi:hypothetical protein Tco_0078577 [Tanacetum coccineum]
MLLLNVDQGFIYGVFAVVDTAYSSKSGNDTKSESFEADMEDPSEEEPTKAEGPPPAQAAPTKRGCAPFTLPPAIETTIIKEIAAPPGERYISPFLSSPPSSPAHKRCRVPSLPSSGPSSPPLSRSPVLAVPPLDVLPPRKRVRSTSPHPDPTKEATTKAIAARLHKRVETHHWEFFWIASILEGDDESKSRLKIISCTTTQKHIQKGCNVFLAHIDAKKTKEKSEEKRLYDVHVRMDFSEVFLEYFPGLPPTRQVEFKLT